MAFSSHRDRRSRRRPATFFVLAKKVTKESRAYEDAPAGCPVLVGIAGGPANSRLAGAQTGRPSKTPAPPALRGAFEGIQRRRVAERWHGDEVSPLGDAAAVRGGSGGVPGACVSPWHAQRDRASFAHGPLTLRSARAACAARRPASCGRLSLVTFFGEAKKVTRPPGEIRLGRGAQGRGAKSALII